MWISEEEVENGADLAFQQELLVPPLNVSSRCLSKEKPCVQKLMLTGPSERVRLRVLPRSIPTPTPRPPRLKTHTWWATTTTSDSCGLMATRRHGFGCPCLRRYDFNPVAMNAFQWQGLTLAKKSPERVSGAKITAALL